MKLKLGVCRDGGCPSCCDLLSRWEGRDECAEVLLLMEAGVLAIKSFPKGDLIVNLGEDCCFTLAKTNIFLQFAFLCTLGQSRVS